MRAFFVGMHKVLAVFVVLGLLAGCSSDADQSSVPTSTTTPEAPEAPPGAPTTISLATSTTQDEDIYIALESLGDRLDELGRKVESIENQLHTITGYGLTSPQFTNLDTLKDCLDEIIRGWSSQRAPYCR